MPKRTEALMQLRRDSLKSQASSRHGRQPRRRSLGSTPTLLQENCVFVVGLAEDADSDDEPHQLPGKDSVCGGGGADQELPSLREVCRLLTLPKRRSPCNNGKQVRP